MWSATDEGKMAIKDYVGDSERDTQLGIGFRDFLRRVQGHDWDIKLSPDSIQDLKTAYIAGFSDGQAFGVRRLTEMLRKTLDRRGF